MILRIVLILHVALKGKTTQFILLTSHLFPFYSPLYQVVVCSEDEERLVRDLFRDYNKLIRPVEVMNETVEVEFGLSFIQLINVVSCTRTIDSHHSSLGFFPFSPLISNARLHFTHCQIE